MDDLISRKAAIDALRYAQHRFTVADEAGGIGTVKWSEDVIYFAAAKNVLADLPSTEQGQHGRWEFIGDQMFRCSECGQTFSKMLLEGWGTYLDRLYLPPCPSCGSYNGGEQE